MKLVQYTLFALLLSSCHITKTPVLTDEEQQEAIQTTYNDIIRVADIYFFENKWLKAREKYREASAIKPNEQYSADQLRIIVEILNSQ
ncbi:MAG: hypothetical protein AB8B72_06035 [Crocinitomicaceae bacterium]